jgi:DNA-binding helix-hairpin-helix protein with protein kinase domain
MSATAPVWTAGGVRLTPTTPLGNGREGVVHAIAEDPRVAVKLYHAAPGARERRVLELLEQPADSWVDPRGRHLRLAWPLGEVLDERGRVAGYAMVRFDQPRHVPLTAVMSSYERQVAGLDLWWPDLLDIAASLAAAVRAVHARGLTFGDLARANALVAPVDHAVVLIDCDGVAHEGRRPPGELFTDETAAPELLLRRPAVCTTATDLWALAVLVCQLLMDGSHPFEGDPVEQDPERPWSAVDNVATRRSRFAPAGLRLAADAVPLAALPPRVRELAATCFLDGASAPHLRPAAAVWEAELTAAAAGLRMCPDGPRHMYVGETGCPWCEMVAAGAPDPFPGPRRRRRRMRFFGRGGGTS